MDCPNCGAYNPEGRTRCWRCDRELPKQPPPKRRDPQKSARTWLYVAVLLFTFATVFRMCGIRMPWSTQGGSQPGGLLGRPAPAVAYVQFPKP